MARAAPASRSSTQSENASRCDALSSDAPSPRRASMPRRKSITPRANEAPCTFARAATQGALASAAPRAAPAVKSGSSAAGTAHSSAAGASPASATQTLSSPQRYQAAPA